MFTFATTKEAYPSNNSWKDTGQHFWNRLNVPSDQAELIRQYGLWENFEAINIVRKLKFRPLRDVCPPHQRF